MYEKRPQFNCTRRKILAWALLFACWCMAFEASASTTKEVLFVANGNYWPEIDIYHHLQHHPNYNVTVGYDFQITAQTNLQAYDVIIITEFSPNISWTGLDNINHAGVPVLIVEDWYFWYAYQLGLVNWWDTAYKYTDEIWQHDKYHEITIGFDDPIHVHNGHVPLYVTHEDYLTDGISKLIGSNVYEEFISVILDEERKILATGISNASYYSGQGWQLFDRYLCYLMDSCIEVSHTADIAPPGTSGSFLSVRPASGSDLLTTTNKGDVYRIDVDGTTTQLFEGAEVPPYTRAITYRNSNNFGVYSEGTYRLYQADGTLLGNQSVSYTAPVPLPDSDFVFTLDITREPLGDGGFVSSASITDAVGAVQSSFDVHGLILFSLTSSNLYWTTQKEFIKTATDGSEQWRLPLIVEKFKVAQNDNRMIVNNGLDTRKIRHYIDDTMTSETPLDAVVWNLDISPNGKYSVATTVWTACLFVDGELQKTVDLPMRYAVSVDINDHGEVLIGGQNADHTSHVLLLSAGRTVWELEYPLVDNNAWRPDVKFSEDGEMLAIRDKSGLKIYRVERSW